MEALYLWYSKPVEINKLKLGIDFMSTGNPIMGQAPGMRRDATPTPSQEVDFTPGEGGPVGAREMFTPEERALFNAAGKSLYVVVEQSPVAMAYTDNYAGADKSGSEVERTRRINAFIRSQLLTYIGVSRLFRTPAKSLEEVAARIRDDGKNRAPVEIEDFAIKALSEDPNMKKYFELKAQAA